MLSLVRDSAVGQVINYLSNGKVLPYRDQQPGYVVPARFLTSEPSTSPRVEADEVISATPSSAVTAVGDVIDDVVDSEVHGRDLEKAVGALKGNAEKGEAPYPYLVEWELDDEDNPRNWSTLKRNFVAGLICLLTFGVYVGSAIYTSSIPGLMEEFECSQVVATLGLTLFVVGYGIGPMLLSPLQDMPIFGRNPIYIIGLFLFVVFQIPVIFAPNIATVLVFRFLAGFVASPAIATGGASMADIFPQSSAAIAIGLWSVGAALGPLFGPVMGGFSAMINGWRWPIYELLWTSGFALLTLPFLLPETLGDTILQRRAERLRRLTGSPLIKTRHEVEQPADETIIRVGVQNCRHAFRLLFEPAILFANSYTALCYIIMYLWFEAFPLVFERIYHFNLGENGLVYLCFLVAAVPTVAVYIWYQNHRLQPRMENDPNFRDEHRLEMGIPAGFFVPVSLLIFGWTSRESVHWIVPTIGASLYMPGIYFLFQAILVYITAGYPKYAASILAGNALFRATLAAVFPLFAPSFYGTLGIGGGCTLLAGVGLLMIPLLWLLIKHGEALRARSQFAQH